MMVGTPEMISRAFEHRRISRAMRLIAPAVRHNLGILATMYRTDKAPFGHGYTPLYERHLGTLQSRPIRLLEIGVGGYECPTEGGASLRTWRDYFPRAEIHGVDIAEKRICEPRIQIHRGDQTDEMFLDDLGHRYGPFDVVIDDGSHIGTHIRASFEALFVKHVKRSGFYVIEDMQTSYMDYYGGGGPGHPGTSSALVQSLVDDVNRRYWTGRYAHPVKALHIYEKIAFVQRS
jgi:hypothetical protein